MKMSQTEKPAANANICFKGSCACKRITYDCTELPSYVDNCHCNTCRKVSGGPYQTYAGVSSKSVTFYDNTEHLRYEGLPKDTIGGIEFLRLSKAGERAYCLGCHTPLAMRYKHEEDSVALTVGTIDEESFKGDEETKKALAPRVNIFVSQRAWWVDVSKDGLPAHDRFSGGFEDAIKAWEGKER